ncbi:hypothetical protein LZ554_004038 [Drepanopeziza brunnea f. sp. 'monogermtubi']|nr:hypothetical protein LZ554_004038 [Drepanopeziza brunnea f. sp. 'monogermtubi']
MSAEIVKKRRGRPKKVISDPVEVEIPESVQTSTTRTKSTKAGAKKGKATPVISAKVSADKKPVSRTVETSAATRIPSTTTTSKILEQVRRLESRKASVPDSPARNVVEQTIQDPSEAAPRIIASNVSLEDIQPKSSAPPPTTRAANAAKPAPVNPPPPVDMSPPPPAAPASKADVPLRELNSAIVSDISTRAGARPNTSSGSRALPKNYKPVARKVSAAIVAMPILIVTSYVLYQRLVLGQEKKLLVPPPPPEGGKRGGVARNQ